MLSLDITHKVITGEYTMVSIKNHEYNELEKLEEFKLFLQETSYITHNYIKLSWFGVVFKDSKDATFFKLKFT